MAASRGRRADGHGGWRRRASTFVNTGTYTKSGTSTTSIGLAFNNSGTVAVNAGTLNLSNGIQGAGTVTVAGTGVVSLAGNATVSTLQTSGATSSLQVGSNTMTVSKDSNNANSGSGNGYVRRAGIVATGTGNQIIAAGNVDQALSGSAITGGRTTAATLTFGNVHVGGSTIA